MIDFGKIQGLTDRSLIESIVCGFFIVDYGFINKVNADKTVNVTHAKKQVLLDGTELPILETPNLEVLTISGSGFSLNFDYKAGDKVLLLGLKDYVEKVKDVNEAKTPETFIHYNRSTLKVLPLCVFNSEAKVKIEIEKGKFSLESEKECVINSSKIELNGNDNNFVTIKLWQFISHPKGTAAFLPQFYCKEPIESEIDIGFSTVGEDIGGHLTTAKPTLNSYKMETGLYRKFLERIAIIKRYGITIKSVDLIASLISKNYKIYFNEDSDIVISYKNQIGFKNLWILTSLFYRFSTIPQVLVFTNEDENNDDEIEISEGEEKE